MVPRYDESMRLTIGDVMTEAIVHVVLGNAIDQGLGIDGEPQLRSFPVSAPIANYWA